MIEYSDSLGKIFGLFGLALVLLVPVILNRILKIKYPLALATLAALYIIASVLERVIFHIVFNIEPSIKPLDGLFSIIIPIYGYVMCLVLDVIAYRLLTPRNDTLK